MKNTLSILFLLLPFIGLSGSVKMDLSEALRNNSVKLEAVNVSGTYRGQTTKLMISNNTKSVLQIKVDVGMILKPEDSSYQPMVLAGEEMLAVMPHAQGEVVVQTFCGNSPKHCPKRDLHYTFSTMAGDTLTKVLKFIKANSLFDHLGQYAVWCITNDHDLSEVYDPDRDVLSKKLIDLIAAATGRPKPDYYKLVPNAQTPGAPAYSGKTLKIIAQFEVKLDAPKTLTLGIYDKDGNMAQPVFENKQFPGKTGHRFDVEFEAENVPEGNYYIRLKEGEQVLQEKVVKVD